MGRWLELVFGATLKGGFKNLQDQLDSLLPAVRAASKAWSSGTNQFISAIQVQKKRVNALVYTN